jgi:hypothetical protein
VAESDDKLVSPRRFTGAILRELRDQYWGGMRRTRANAALERQLLAGELSETVHENFTIAGIDAFYTETPHMFTVPQRVRQALVKRRPTLSIPLGPKGVGVTSQRLTTRVEQPLNAICEHPQRGFKWEDTGDITTFEGFCVSVTSTDVTDWQSKKPSAWADPKERTWQKRYRVDEQGRGEDDDGYTDVDPKKARALYEDDLAHFRARHLPIRHRVLSIMDCAPVFGEDLSVEGLIVVQEYSLSQLRRRFYVGDLGLPTPTGRNNEMGGEGSASTQTTGKPFTVIEGWFYDEDGCPYVSYCLEGAKEDTRELRWKAPGWKHDGEVATLDLHKHRGLDRLPIAWEWGLSFSTRNPDDRALPFTRPFRPGWLGVNRSLSAVNAWLQWRGYPGLIVKTKLGAGSLDEDDEPDIPDISPMKITRISDAEDIMEIASGGLDPAVFAAIELQLGANESEGPSKAQEGASGFAMSLAEAFEQQALTTIHQSLGRLYEAHGSFVLEAGKRIPKAIKGDPIMVYRSTDVPTTDKAGGPKLTDGPMELDPDLIDETFTVKAKYPQEMSLPERQQSAELVERRLKTRRKHLEDDGEQAPETVELELIAEDQRSDPAYKQYLMKLVAQIQGEEEMEEIAQGQQEGLMDEDGLPTALAQGVMALPPGGPPALGPGMAPPPMPGDLGVPQGGDMTGMGGPSTAQAVLAGAVGGAMQQGPINRATAAGGIVPPDLPVPGAI